jgi:hypothetical protein
LTWIRRASLLGVLATVLAAHDAAAQVSPGPLSAAHASLEGNTRCFECHASKNDGMDGRCLDCHEEIASLRAAGRGLHSNVAGKACAGCHPEHAGREFALVEWPGGGPRSFDHARAGWPLEEKHATLDCRACHREKFRTGAAAARAKVEDASRSWVGLEPSCAACHEDPHRGALGAECSRCHTARDWKTVPAFDHAATAFPLAGKHLQVTCAKCHQAQGRSAPVYKPLPHAECSSCHKDAHAGRLGAACGSCHTAAGWREVPKTAFDHDRTRYPLRGAHRSIACAACHDSKKAWGARPAFADCAGCHRDPHAGKATLAGARADCDACHTVDAFAKGVLEASRHAPERFPLAGKHAAVACRECHERDGSPAALARLGRAGVELHPAHERCATCHTDAHRGQLASRSDRGECAACHGVEGWKPSRFGAEQHRDLALPLEGAHLKLPCARCHGGERPGLAPLPRGLDPGPAKAALRGIERECAGCHRDPHRFAPARACTDCHDARAFVPSRFDLDAHAKTNLPLEGAHRAVPCSGCHKALAARAEASSLIRGPGAAATLGFEDKRRACADCHPDPHGGQFAASAGGGCERCHAAAAFRPASRFDHERDARFRLGTAHRGVACERCHVARSGPDSRPTVVYRGVSSTCRDCHGPQQAGTGERS